MDPPPPKRPRVLSDADWAPVLAAAERFRGQPGTYELEVSRLASAAFGPTAFGPVAPLFQRPPPEEWTQPQPQPQQGSASSHAASEAPVGVSPTPLAAW